MSKSQDVQPRTVPLSTLGAFDLGFERRVSLLIYHRDGMEAVPLAQDCPVVVGREHPSSVRVAHPSLSRQHARFELREDGVWIEDLGSTNGTRVAGQELSEPRRLDPGQEAALGSVTAVVHTVEPTAGQLTGLLGHERFLTRLEQEIPRHRFFDRRLGLVLLRAEQPAATWFPEVSGLLRPVDLAGLYSASAVELLIPEADEAALRELGRALAAAVKGRCGLALYPDVGATAEALLEAVRAAVGRTSRSAPVQLAGAADEPAAQGAPVVQSAAMQKVYASVERLARAAIPVLIVGETGSGKEVIARAIHQGSDRAGRPLRCINCAAIPSQLVESTLFGHEKGAFTGADHRANGVFHEADGGSVLLDEIGELSPAAQAALLRVLETKRVSRVGSTAEVEVDVRVLAATHRNLEAMCEAGEFRWDLLYRVNTMTLRVPPLRDRPEEIEPLVRCFLEQANQENGRQVRGLDPLALELVRAYRWPGNVRELRNVIHRAVVMTAGETITVEDLPEQLARAQEGPPTGPLPTVEPAAADEELDYRERILRHERELITSALRACGGNQTEAARRLRMPIRTLAHKIKTLGIEVSRG